MKIHKTAAPSERLVRAAIDGTAVRILRIKTLEAQNSDELDLHERHVLVLEDALRRAYVQGFVDGTAARRR